MENIPEGTARGYTVMAMITYAFIIAGIIISLMTAVRGFKDKQYARGIITVILDIFGFYEPILVVIAMVITIVINQKEEDAKHKKINLILTIVLLSLLVFMQIFSSHLTSEIQNAEPSASAEITQ